MRSYLIRSALAGVATGLRSTVAVASLIEASDPGLPRRISVPAVRIGAALGILGELVLDKLPRAPSRLSRGAIGGRLGMAAIAATLIARGEGRPLLPALCVACVTAVVGAKVGHDARASLAERVSGMAVALLEDIVALGLAAGASRVGS